MTKSRAATSLEGVYETLSPEPLLTKEQLQAFYGEELNRIRGGDQMALMELGLNRRHGGAYYKAFLMGHSGVGKSTELTRLINAVENKFRAIRFSALSDLDPANFRPFDVPLVMMIKIAEETAKPINQGGAGHEPSDKVLQDIWNWFATETRTHSQQTHVGAEAAAGMNPGALTWWTKALGLFASLKGEIKYASDRNKQIVEYRLSRLASLVELLNRLLDECNDLLRETTGCEWLLIGEDFDRAGIPDDLTKALFLNYANLFKDLRTHLIFNIPISLVYSEKRPQLPALSDPVHCIPDTPVFDEDHTPHQEGREALRAILEARVSLELFEPDVCARLIVASGGNLRDLFSLVSQAADNALLRPDCNGKVNDADADRVIDALRTDYERRLGESVFDEAKVTYEDKAERLLKIYSQDQTAKIPNAVLHSLLHARAVQEFNGKRWFGVHPLVVDILHAQGRIKASVDGKVRGGTE
ncbi:MAG: hypothetical protein M3347_05395, partial [Armatimonadota bacterium]|nr:hypothetical protein [Armatimonadota bacterium]